MTSPLINCSGRVPGRVHMAWARWPNTAASTVESFGPIRYFLSPVQEIIIKLNYKKLEKKKIFFVF